ncbi:MAG: hypothetical protein AAFN93_09695, partial [Bacteroidota bacterium]
LGQSFVNRLHHIPQGTQAKWLCRKYKRFGKSARKAHRYLRDLARRNPSLFAHWKRGIIET